MPKQLVVFIDPQGEVTIKMLENAACDKVMGSMAVITNRWDAIITASDSNRQAICLQAVFSPESIRNLVESLEKEGVKADWVILTEVNPDQDERKAMGDWNGVLYHLTHILSHAPTVLCITERELQPFQFIITTSHVVPTIEEAIAYFLEN